MYELEHVWIYGMEYKILSGAPRNVINEPIHRDLRVHSVPNEKRWTSVKYLKRF